MPAIPPHGTATVEGPWDANAQVSKISDTAGAATLRGMYAWVDGTADADLKGSYKFPHHEVSGGKPGAANTNGVRNALSRLPQANIPGGDRAGVKAHLQRHLDDGNKSGGRATIYGERAEPAWQL